MINWLSEWFPGAIGNVGCEHIRRAARAISCALNCSAQRGDFLCAPGASHHTNFHDPCLCRPRGAQHFAREFGHGHHGRWFGFYPAYGFYDGYYDDSYYDDSYCYRHSRRICRYPGQLERRIQSSFARGRDFLLRLTNKE